MTPDELRRRIARRMAEIDCTASTAEATVAETRARLAATRHRLEAERVADQRQDDSVDH